jgi:triosephosphate isomerase (TIM)
MKKNFAFIANWKMYLNFNQETEFATSNYDNFVELSNNKKNNIILCPSFLNLKTLIQIFRETEINIGAQNCSSHSKGSYTGQISAESLNLANCRYCIIGHSETKKHLIEDDINEKLKQLINNKISPILCIGEDEESFKNQNTINILEKQLSNILDLIKNNNIKQNIYIAYEPIWSIGSGNIATLDHLENVFAWLYKKIQTLKNNHINLLYGGSVNSQNASNLKKITNLDGFLIGKASLDFQEFKKIVEL